MARKSKRRRTRDDALVDDLPAEATDVLDDPDDDAVPTVAAVVRGGAIIPTPPVAGDEPKKIMRPSELTALIAKEADAKKIPVGSIDRFRFLQDHGLPNPTKAYRVIGLRKGKQTKPVEIPSAVDESDAISQVVTKLGISQTHQWRFRCLVTAE